MRIGILCEGTFTDAPVLRALLVSVFPQHEFLVHGKDKRVIFEAADLELNVLFEAGAERAIIIWDLLPFNYQGGVACQWSDQARRAEQRQVLVNLLTNSTVLHGDLRAHAIRLAARYGFRDEEDNGIIGGPELFSLVCVCYHLDGWLLSDPDVLAVLASSPGHTVRGSNLQVSKPDLSINPTGELRGILKHHRRFRKFNKFQHNLVIANCYISEEKVGKMRASQSFARTIATIQAWT